MNRYIITICILFLAITYSKAQTPFCIDSLRIRYGAYCQPDFQPVCGCDGVTYRNQCFADINGLISYSQGICENIAMDINPNPTVNDIFINIITKYQGDVDFYIYNHYGKLFLYRKFYQVTTWYYPINIEVYPAGPYIIIAKTGDDFVAKKIIKHDF